MHKLQATGRRTVMRPMRRSSVAVSTCDASKPVIASSKIIGKLIISGTGVVHLGKAR
jgi:hypothetical protein